MDYIQESEPVDQKLKGLPRGIIEPRTDLELKPLWSSSSLRSKVSAISSRSVASMIEYIAT